MNLRQHIKEISQYAKHVFEILEDECEYEELSEDSFDEAQEN